MPYMRIESGKFWGWVVVSLLVGLGIGLAIMLVRTGSLSDQITVLQHQLSSASTGATESVSAIQTQLASAEASITALTDQNAQLTSDLAAANTQTTASTTTGSTTTTPTLVITSRTISPSSVTASGTITMTAKVTGSPASVVMRVYNSSKSWDKRFTLHKVSTSGKTQTWRATAAAPTKTGTYHFYATATKGSTSVTMTGASPGTLTVK
jgi:uncharacterized membrane-anchored protein YhcB (DUF1043 family)